MIFCEAQGDARMVTDDGGLALQQLINSYRLSQMIHVAAKLRIADFLSTGARTSNELAAATDAHSGALYRLLRALAAAGFLSEGEAQSFSLTAVGQHLRSDVPDSRRAWALFSGQPSNWTAWQHLLHSVRTGENAFKHVYGTDVWEYRARNPEEGDIFDRAMREGSVRAFADLSRHYDFGRFARIADVGGGDGTFLASVLKKHIACRGILYDQPHVVAAARSIVQEARVAARCAITGGDFFVSVPQDCDAYILKYILHDWEDEEAVSILRVCRKAAGLSSKLIVIERVLGPANSGLEAKLSDLNMLVSAGGRERTIDEFARLFQAADFEIASIVHGGGQLTIIEALPI